MAANPTWGHRAVNSAHSLYETVMSQLDDGPADRQSASSPDGSAQAPSEAASVLGSLTERIMGDVQPAVPSTSEDGYRFTLQNPNGIPVHWDSCTSHGIVVNLDGAPDGAMRDLHEAVSRLNSATGQTFQIVGTTDSRPSPNWGKSRSSGSWAPILVAWAPSKGSYLLSGGKAGATQPVWVNNPDGTHHMVSGEIVFNTDYDYQSGFPKGVPSQGTLMLHELGHLAGLAHVDDPNQVMYPKLTDRGAYNTGDLAGLAQLGGSCG